MKYMLMLVLAVGFAFAQSEGDVESAPSALDAALANQSGAEESAPAADPAPSATDPAPVATEPAPAKEMGPMNAVGIGFVDFGLLAFNYERLLMENGGIFVQYSPIGVEYSFIKIDGFQFMGAYRWHIGGGIDAFYLSPFYKMYSIEVSVDDETAEIGANIFGLAIGDRSMWFGKYGGVAWRMGYGMAMLDLDWGPAAVISGEMKDAEEFVEMALGFDTEFSLFFSF
jgi:hypothetical protein